MPVGELKTEIARLPEQPGVYIFGNTAGETIYVGKARSLRDRVRTYLSARGSSPKTDALLDEAGRLEVIVTDSVVEALALENHLIKQRTPKYNILLRDDKTYPYLQLTTSEAFPRVLVARRVERDGNVYAGPFMPASLARGTMGLTHRLFGIRSCNEEITGRRPRPCLEYDIKRCIAPCVETLCSRERYAHAVGDTRLFLEGRNDELIAQLLGRMEEAASVERFEEAAQLRDAMRTVQTLRDRQQKIATTTFGDRDAFGLKVGPAGAVIQVFQMRNGRVIERVELIADAEQPAADAAEVLQAALQQFYEAREVPPEVDVPIELDEAELVEAWLSERAGRRVHLRSPKRGEKRALLDLATRNAELAYQTRAIGAGAANVEALETLRAVLALPLLPRRIECFDISTIQGSETVASMVVCEDGRMKRGEYRKYRVRGLQGLETREQGAGIRDQGREARGAGAVTRSAPGPRPPIPGPRPDDVAAMHEVVFRRYRKLLEQGGPFPDLILIDGGKGQVSAAYEALERLGLANLVAVGLAKKEELLFTRDRSEPIAFAPSDQALLLLERIRDEAHRFAVTFHRRARRMRDLRSELDTIPGIGRRRRRALLATFGSVAGVRRASREELAAVVGARAAGAVLRHFSQ
jgi:excinuclease ABC subunit C